MFITDLKFSFSWIGLIVFALPMLINIAYVLFPPADQPAETAPAARWVERVEKISRIAYLAAIVLLASNRPVRPCSAWMIIAALFLILYYAVWLRYFIDGRKTALLGEPFCFVPMPLAIFPVIYYLCAALWLHNLPAAALMIIFGAAHLAVSLQSFRKS